VARLFDFGIAKVLNRNGPRTRRFTRTDWRPMTPEYASPEQCVNRSQMPRISLFALGVLLYELLAGHRPYRVRSDSPLEIERSVCGGGTGETECRS